MSTNLQDYNKDELDPPNWLNTDFFTEVLQKSENNNSIEVKQFKITPATLKGDHYASIMFRAVVDYRQQGQEKTKPLIIKTEPEVDGHKMELLQETFVYETETAIYRDAIPRFEQILREVGDNTVFAPRFIYHSFSPKKLLILEDLVPQGYKVIRDRDADINEVKGAYLKLAKWHAVSYKLAKEDPKFFDQYRHSFMTMPNLLKDDMVTGGLTRFLEMLENDPSLIKYKPYFERMQDNLVEKCAETFKEYRDNPQTTSSYVLCHGDFHCKNMMFKHAADTGVLEDVMLLDHQIAYVGPIVNDVIYSFFLLLNTELRTNHLDELIYFYFSNFTETLQKIGFEGRIPTLVEFRQQLVQHRHFEMFLLVSFLPLWYAFRSEKQNFEEIFTSSDFRKKYYTIPEFKEDLHRLLPKYLHLGYFDSC